MQKVNAAEVATNWSFLNITKIYSGRVAEKRDERGSERGKIDKKF